MSKTVQVLLILFLVELFGGFMSNLFVGGSASLFLIIIGARKLFNNNFDIINCYECSCS
jgi:hypothetical protein